MIKIKPDFSLQTQLGKKKKQMGKNGPRTYWIWDQVPWKSKHPQLTSHTRREPYFLTR
jgi:hypothetical protein